MADSLADRLDFLDVSFELKNGRTSMPGQELIPSLKLHNNEALLLQNSFDPSVDMTDHFRTKDYQNADIALDLTDRQGKASISPAIINHLRLSKI